MGSANMKEGLAAVQSEKPDLTILDVMLPDGDGFSLTAQSPFCPRNFCRAGSRSSGEAHRGQQKRLFMEAHLMVSIM